MAFDGGVGEQLRVSFACQRCLQPLRIDPSFYAMDEHTLAELTLPMSPAPDVDIDASAVDNLVPPLRLRGRADNSSNNSSNSNDDNNNPGLDDDDDGGSDGPKQNFTLVGESGETVTLGTRLRMTAELFDVVSDNSDVDHPLCEECTDALLETMDQQLQLAEVEAQEYRAYLQRLEGETEDDGRVGELEAELERLEAEESRLRADLGRLEADQADAEAELAGRRAERAELEREERKYWREYSRHNRRLLSAEDDFRSLECQLRYAQGQMERLRKTNVFNATFHIWHTGHFATINGFRLGRLPSVPVEWSEINAAWGQTALLLWSLARRVGLERFERWQLVPYGSRSYLRATDSGSGKTLPLYGSGGFRMMFADTKFDMAMVAFLDCLGQFAAEVQTRGVFALPYEMDAKGKIRDVNSGQWNSVRLQFNSDDAWTKALRYMLTNLKWGLAFVSMHHYYQAGADDDQPAFASLQT